MLTFCEEILLLALDDDKGRLLSLTIAKIRQAIVDTLRFKKI